jgi:hypothetical protein
MVQCIVHAVVAVTVYTIIYTHGDRKAAGHGMIKTTDLKLVPPSPLIHKYAAYMVDRIHNYAIVQNTEVKAYSIDPDRHLVMLS